MLNVSCCSICLDLKRFHFYAVNKQTYKHFNQLSSLLLLKFRETKQISTHSEQLEAFIFPSIYAEFYFLTSCQTFVAVNNTAAWPLIHLDTPSGGQNSTFVL